MNTKILEEIKKNHEKDEDNELEKNTNKYIKKVTDNLENFSYNKIIANLHEIHSFLSKQMNRSYKKETIKNNYEKILISMIPVIPHFSSECLKLIDAKNIKWPTYDISSLKEDKINIVIQINGKKRALLETKPNLPEEDIFKLTQNNETLSKYLEGKKIKKKIYIKDRLMNILL